MTETHRLAEAASTQADALEEANDIEGAIRALSEAIELAPDKPVYRALRGRLHHLHHKWHAAVRDFDSALAVRPKHPTWLYGRGRARFMLDDFDGAIADFKNCIALEPDAADAWAQIGHIHRYRRDWEQAIHAYERALELNFNDGAELEDLILAMKEQIWLRDNGQLEPSETPASKYTPASQDPEHILRRDELREIQQKRRQAVVPYQRNRLHLDDSEK